MGQYNLQSPNLFLFSKNYIRRREENVYAPASTHWDNGDLSVLIPQDVIAWTAFTEDPTKVAVG